MNILNGGKHADNNIDFQEFMIMPIGATFLPRGAAHRLRSLSQLSKKCFTTRGLNTAVGDEGGIRPPRQRHECLEILAIALPIQKGSATNLATRSFSRFLDPATSELR